MKKYNFKYQKKEGIEDKEVVVIRENGKYVEGYELNDEITENTISKVNGRYRKFKRGRITENKPNIDNIELLKKLENAVEYYSEFDMNQYDEQIQDQIRKEIYRIYSTIRNLNVLLSKK